MVLAKGLKFIPTPKTSDKDELQSSLDRLFRSLKIKLYFNNHVNKLPNTQQAFKPKFHIPKLTWNPPVENKTLSIYIERTQQLFNQIYKNLQYTQFHFPRNTTKSERIFITTIKNDNSLIIKPSDKNLGIALMDKSWYINEIERQLNDTDTYKSADKNTIVSLIQEVITDIHQLLQRFPTYFTEQAKKFLTHKTQTEQIQVPVIYILPKVHKPKLTGRPIVPSHSWCTSALSKWLDDQLQSLKPFITTTIKDSKTLVNQLEKLRIPHQNCVLITADVNSLYTEIPTADGITLMQNFLREYVTDAKLRMLYLRSLEIILYNNGLEFNGKFFIQIKGTAMGTSVAPIYADIFLFMLEIPTLKKLSFTPLFYVRYLDDILIILEHAHQTIELTTGLNNMHKNIVLDFKVNQESNEYLDLEIYKGKRFKSLNILDIKVHQKSMNMYLYIPYRSFHTQHNKSGLIKTELIRYIRISSSFDDYLKTKKALYTRLIARGYPIKFLNLHFNSVKYKDRNIYLADKVQTKDNQAPLIFSTDFNPFTKLAPIKHAIRMNWNILKTNKETLMLHSNPPHMAWKKGKTLLELISQRTL